MLRIIGLTVACTLIWLTTYPMSLSAQPSAAKLGTNDVDTNSSRVYILVDKSGLGHAHGVEGQFTTALSSWATKVARAGSCST